MWIGNNLSKIKLLYFLICFSMSAVFEFLKIEFLQSAPIRFILYYKAKYQDFGSDIYGLDQLCWPVRLLDILIPCILLQRSLMNHLVLSFQYGLSLNYNLQKTNMFQQKCLNFILIVSKLVGQSWPLEIILWICFLYNSC